MIQNLKGVIMKKFTIIFLALLSAAGLFACDTEENEPDIPPPPAVSDGEYVEFEKGDQIYVVVNEQNQELAYSLNDILTEATDQAPMTMTDGYSKRGKEFIIGKCERALSEKAYIELEKLQRENIFTARILFYFEDGSIALAYDEISGYEKYVFEHAVKSFAERYASAKDGIHAEAGEVYTETVDLLKYQKEIDEMNKNTAWENAENILGREAVTALKEMYSSIYSKNLADWFANLFDPKTGGFYYSNSARDNEMVEFYGSYYELLPDIESTEQALYFINRSGMISGLGGMQNAFPDWMKESLIKFVKERQDPNGYFYHPQWPKSMVDEHLSRKGRDLTKALNILTMLGAKPTYDTPTGVKGDGISADGTPVSKVSLTKPLGVSVASAAASAVASTEDIPAHLRDEASFKAYLAQYDNSMSWNSYWIGNQLAAQADQIKARDRALRDEGANYSLVAILHAWLDGHCNKSTGHWSENANYDGLNGLMKISATYQSLEIPLPYPEAAVRSAIATIDTDESNETVCYAYNSWFTVSNIINNVNRHRPAEEAAVIIDSIRSELRSRAPELIRATMEKQGKFICSDSSFGYTVAGSSSTSQGLPVAILNVKEGDINSTLICTSGTLEQVFWALGCPEIPILGRSDFNRFLSIIEENRSKIQ